MLDSQKVPLRLPPVLGSCRRRDVGMFLWIVRYIVILTVQAPEITSHCCNGIGTRSGMEMEQGLFLYRIFMPSDYLSVDQGINTPSQFSLTAHIPRLPGYIVQY